MPLNGAFVVQFRESSEWQPGWFRGRVEHLMSAQNATFVTARELFEFFERVMNQRAEDQVKRKEGK